MQAVGAHPSVAFDAKARNQAFGLNHEHPALLKTLAGLSATWWTTPARPEGAAMRLPAQGIAGVGVGLLVAAGGKRYGLWAGLLAGAFFIALPHVWFHAGLATFDVPVAVASLAVALVYLRSLGSPAWGL